MSLAAFLQHLPPPSHPRGTGTPKTWEKVERELGLRLPADYKQLMDHYGTGAFDDFIRVYNPFAETEEENLFFALDTLNQAEEQTRLWGAPDWTVVRPFRLYPAPEGLLPWGRTANFGEVFFWQLTGAPPTWETIFYHLRTGEYEVWKLPMMDFLLRLFTRQITSVLLPEDFPSAALSFATN